MKLTLKSTKIQQLSKYPGEEQCTQVLVVSSHLTPPIAEKLRCREVCFDEKGVPRKFDAYAPSVTIRSADVILGEESHSANLIHKFKIGRPRGAAENDVSLEVKFRLHFDGSLHLADWVERVNKGEFILAINARQADLDFGAGEEKAAEEEEEEADSGCIQCNNGIPMSIASGIHESGARCTKDDKEPALASAREMGGTHQAKKRGGKQAEAVQ